VRNGRVCPAGQSVPAAEILGSGERGGVDAGDGGGFGVMALPRGAFTIDAGKVRWHSGVNVNLLVVAATVVAVTYLGAGFGVARRPG
jgi:hypothetical protein